MSIEEKLVAIAENVPQVYEAGYKKGKEEGGGVGINDSIISAESAWSSKNTVDKLCPAFTENGAIVTCEPVEGYPMKVTTGYGWETIAKLASEMEDSTTRLRYTLEPGATYQVMAESHAEIYNVYAETVSGVNLPLQDVQILDTTATYRLTAPEDLQEDVFLFTSNGVSRATLTIRKWVAASRVFRTGKNLWDFKQTAQKLTYFDASGTEIKKCGFDIVLPAGTYYIAAYEKSDCIVDEKTVLRYVYMYFLDVNKTQYKIPSTEHLVVEVSQGDPKSFKKQKIVIPEGFTLLVVDALTGQNLERTNAVFQSLNIQIEAGATATAYEPYQGGEFTPGEEIPALQGVNYIWADVGEVTVTGRKDPIAIIEKLSSAVTAMLGG